MSHSPTGAKPGAGTRPRMPGILIVIVIITIVIIILVAVIVMVIAIVIVLVVIGLLEVESGIVLE